MVAIYQTAYPRLKQEFSPKDLDTVYTATPKEIRFALRHCKRSSASFLGLLVQLKIVQRLGRFISVKEIPQSIIAHIKATVRSRSTQKELSAYFSSGAKDRHVKLIRRYLHLQAFDSDTTGALVFQWALDAARTKEALADIINVALEYLVKEQYEIPAFSVLQRLCQRARAQINNTYYDQLCAYLDTKGQKIVARLLNTTNKEDYGWHGLKHEAKRPTPRNIHAYIHYLEWLSSLQSMLPNDLGLPPTKHRQYINEAKALDRAEMMKLKVNKRTALVIVLIRHQYAQTLDSAALIVIKTLQKMHRSAEKLLEAYLSNHQKQTDRLISVLSSTMKVYLDKPDNITASDPILGQDSQQIFNMCEQYMAYAGNNYLPFMVSLYKKTALCVISCD